jgi:hypothetical protein
MKVSTSKYKLIARPISEKLQYCIFCGAAAQRGLWPPLDEWQYCITFPNLEFRMKSLN